MTIQLRKPLPAIMPLCRAAATGMGHASVRQSFLWTYGSGAQPLSRRVC